MLNPCNFFLFASHHDRIVCTAFQEVNEFTLGCSWSRFSDPCVIVVTAEEEKNNIWWSQCRWVDCCFLICIDKGVVDRGVIFDKLEKADHNNLVFLESLDGHIWAFYTQHNKDVLFMSKSSFKNDIVTWGKAKTLNSLKTHLWYAKVYIR